jgi:hypothetical protein
MDQIEPKKIGRPLKFKTVEELDEKIQAYFKSCFDFARDMWGNRLIDKESKDKNIVDGEGKPVFLMKQVKPFTVTSLAVYLDTYRDVLIDYETGNYDNPDISKDINEQFSNTIKKAKSIIYAYAEEQLFIGKNAAGVIFNIVNNYKGWKNTSEFTGPNGTPLMPTVIVLPNNNRDGSNKD